MLYFLVAAVVLTVALIVWINYGFAVTEKELTYASLPHAFDGYRVALISDLHDSTFGYANKRLTAALKKLKPDIIAVAGDMHQSSDDGEYLAFVRELCKIAPVYMADGNHEAYWHTREDYGDYYAELAATGANILCGNGVYITRGGESIRVYGISYHEYKKGSVEAEPGIFNIALLHNPFWFDEIENKPELMLSGHVHGGVIRLPGIGGLFVPGGGVSFFRRWKRSFFFPSYSKGIYGDGEHRLAVTVGLGKVSVQPFRFIRPEIMILTLKSTR